MTIHLPKEQEAQTLPPGGDWGFERKERQRAAALLTSLAREVLLVCGQHGFTLGWSDRAPAELSVPPFEWQRRRSVAACNGLVGDVDGRDCFSTGTNTWYSSRAWDTPQPWFTDTAGPAYKADWHRLEAYFSLNTIQAGVGVPDGKIRLRMDGQTVVTSDRVLFRTNQHPDMHFTQFLMLPYIGDGSPLVQQFWVDQLKVATGAVP